MQKNSLSLYDFRLFMSVRRVSLSLILGAVLACAASLSLPEYGSAKYNFGTVAAGKYHSLAIDKDGYLYAWGMNSFGMLGCGTTQSLRTTPFRIGSNNDWISVSAGEFFSLALNSQGQLFSWGRNQFGQLGCGGDILSRSALQIIEPQVVWREIAAGGSHALAIDEEGRLFAWGRDNNGHAGVSIRINSPTPIQIGSDSNWTAVSVGFTSSVALNSSGEIHRIDDTGVDTTRIAQGHFWTSVASATTHTLAINSRGELFTWGQNRDGQLGDNSRPAAWRTEPGQIGTEKNWVHVAAGDSFALAINSDGELFTWGGNWRGQLGDGTNDSSFVPLQVGFANEWVYASSLGQFVLAADKNGELYAWGDNGFGQIGNGSSSSITAPWLNPNLPVRVERSQRWTGIFSGDTHSLLICSSGQLFGFGPVRAYGIGGESFAPAGTPGRFGGTDIWVDAATGADHSLAINNEGHLYAVGINVVGQLGIGTTSDSFTRVRVSGEGNWTSVSAGGHSSFAINSRGELYAWGENISGLLGLGFSGSPVLQPLRVGHASNWVSVSASPNFVLALNDLGHIYSWGNNTGGTLGIGSFGGSRTQPIRIGHSQNWTDISAGFSHALAINDQGDAFAWGSNFSGTLGTGDTNHRSAPVRVESAHQWVRVKAGSSSSMGISTEGKLFTWGSNGQGQLGVGTFSGQSLLPTQISDSKSWQNIALGLSSAFAIDDAGKLFSWGRGALGDGPSVSRSEPGLVGSAVTFGGFHVFERSSALVTFNSAGGSSISSRFVAAGRGIGSLQVPTREGYKFDGWWTQTQGGVRVTPFCAFLDQTELFARWASLTPPQVPPQQLPPQQPQLPQQSAAVLPASITINHPNAGALMLVGQTRQLSANVLPANAANRNVVWTSSNPAVATVAANGQLRAVRPGNATITARTAAGNRVATTTVRIQASPAALNSSQRNIRMRQGTTFRIPLIVRGTTNTDVTVNWRTTNRNVATLVAGRTNGTMNIRQNASRVLTIRAVRPGTARIVLTAQNGRTITYNITVQRNNQRLNRVRISNLPPRNTMNRNVTRNLSYRVTPVRATKTGQVRWTSSRPRVATIDQAGRLQSRERGQTIITLRVGTQVHRVTVTVR